MTYIVTKPCLGVVDRSCVEVCPVDCFYHIKKRKYNERFGVEAEDEDKIGMMLINPDECINCGACETECPVEAIYEDSSVPEDQEEFIKVNEDDTLELSDDEKDEFRCTTK